MNGDWTICIKRGDERRLAELRGFDGVEIAETDDAIWLRVAQGDETLDRALRAVPGVRYRVLADGQLLPDGLRIPHSRLPKLDWSPLARWLRVRLPVAALPGQVERRVALQVVRTSIEQTPTALVTDVDAWVDYCTTAAEIRLRPLAFAVSADRRAFILGTPLPPLPGVHYVVRDGIALPCGFEFQPRIGGALLRQLLQLDSGDVCLFAADGTYERIAHDHLVAAGRAAARATAEALGHD